MFRRSALPAVAIAALVVGLALGWSLRRPPQPATPRPAQLPAIGLHQATIVLRHQGARQAEVHADRVEVSRDLRYATFSGTPTAIVFSDGRDAFRVRGSSIVLDRQTSNVLVQGPVEVTSARGERLTAGTVRWLNAARQLVFQDRVMMTAGDQELVAEELTIDVGQQTLDFSGGVDVAFRLESVKP